MRIRLEHSYNEILMAGTQDIYLRGLSQMLDRIGAALRISKAVSERELKVYLEKKSRPELFILVSPLINQNSFSILNDIYGLNNSSRILLMAEDYELPMVFSFVKEGVKTILSKSCTEAHLIQALNSLHNNTYYFSPAFADIVINKGLNSLSLKGKVKLVQISEREKEIIRLMWKDYTNKEIADLLKVSMRTVESHRNSIYEKLNVKTLGGIFKYGLDNGIIS